MPHTFFDPFDPDLQRSLLQAIRALWTHASTAIEGNILTLGETTFVLAEGLTVSGKPLKDHQEVVGHARALDLLLDLAYSDRPVVVEDLYSLHRAVQNTVLLDAQCPVGAWKNSPNGTQAVDATGQFRFIEYATPEDVPLLMADWLSDLNQSLTSWPIQNTAVRYADLHQAFVRIHPFCDGNGRMARLLTNLPLLRAGLPPIVIPREHRIDYIRLLALYDLEIGPAKAGTPLLRRAITSLSGPSARLPAPWWMPCSKMRAKPRPGGPKHEDRQRTHLHSGTESQIINRCPHCGWMRAHPHREGFRRTA